MQNRRPPSAKRPQPACRTSVVAAKRLRTIRSADQITLPQQCSVCNPPAQPVPPRLWPANKAIVTSIKAFDLE